MILFLLHQSRNFLRTKALPTSQAGAPPAGRRAGKGRAPGALAVPALRQGKCMMQSVPSAALKRRFRFVPAVNGLCTAANVSAGIITAKIPVLRKVQAAGKVKAGSFIIPILQNFRKYETRFSAIWLESGLVF